jgi:hypothetical protein
MAPILPGRRDSLAASSNLQRTVPGFLIATVEPGRRVGAPAPPDLGREYPIRVDRVEADSAAGQALVGAHRPAMFPLVLVDGAFFSAGRLPRRKLRALLATKPVGAAS